MPIHVPSTPEQLRSLGSSRASYWDAQRLFALQCVGLFTSAIVLVIFSNQSEYIRETVAPIIALVLTTADFFVEKAIDGRKERTAKLQEAFDCEVMELPWSKLATGEDEISHTEQSEWSVAYTRHDPKHERLKDWYPPLPDGSPIHVRRLIYQAVNITWNKSQQIALGKWTFVAGLTLMFLLFLVPSLLKMNYRDAMASLISPAIPMAIFLYRQRVEHIDSVKAYERLDRYLMDVWKHALTSKSKPDSSTPAELLGESRRLQDELYHQRCRRPIIFGWYHHFARNRNEDVAKDLANRMAAEWAAPV